MITQDFASPFLTYLEEEDNPTFESPEEEIRKLDQRAKAIDDFLETGKHPDLVLDMLAEHGIEPTVWVDAVCENVQLFIYKSVPVDLAGFHLFD